MSAFDFLQLFAKNTFQSCFNCRLDNDWDLFLDLCIKGNSNKLIKLFLLVLPVIGFAEEEKCILYLEYHSLAIESINYRFSLE